MKASNKIIERNTQIASLMKGWTTDKQVAYLMIAGGVISAEGMAVNSSIPKEDFRNYLDLWMDKSPLAKEAFDRFCAQIAKAK